MDGSQAAKAFAVESEEIVNDVEDSNRKMPLTSSCGLGRSNMIIV